MCTVIRPDITHRKMGQSIKCIYVFLCAKSYLLHRLCVDIKPVIWGAECSMATEGEHSQIRI